MSTKTLYFIRHGEAHHNVLGFDTKQFDPALTTFGREQAAKIKGRVELVVMSPLLRTRETLLYSKLVKNELVETPLVREWTHYGASSLLQSEAKLLEAKKLETEQEFVNRCKEAIVFFKSRPETTIAIMGHGVCNAKIIQLLTGKNVRFANAQVIAIKI